MTSSLTIGTGRLFSQNNQIAKKKDVNNFQFYIVGRVHSLWALVFLA